MSVYGDDDVEGRLTLFKKSSTRSRDTFAEQQSEPVSVRKALVFTSDNGRDNTEYTAESVPEHVEDYGSR